MIQETGRIAMISNKARVVAVMLATLATPAVIFATASPAFAGTHLHETYGAYFVNADNLNLYTPVVENSTTGRDLTISWDGTTYVDGFHGVEIYFNLDHSKCVAAANNLSDVNIHPCNGGYGVIWGEIPLDPAHGVYEFFNREATQATGVNLFLAGRNNKTQYQLNAGQGFGLRARGLFLIFGSQQMQQRRSPGVV
jgi:hypothetical protein